MTCHDYIKDYYLNFKNQFKGEITNIIINNMERTQVKF